MVVHICPRCQQRYICATNNTDYIHECINNPTLQNEDLPLTGAWTDYTGSAIPAVGDIFNTSRINKLDGTRAALEGNRLHNYTVRGNNADTTRTRAHLHYIDLKEDK